MADISKEYKQYKRAKLLYQELCKKYRAVCLRLNEEYEYGSTSSPIEIYQSDDWNIKWYVKHGRRDDDLWKEELKMTLQDFTDVMKMRSR